MIQWRDYLASDPAVCGGQLCAKGTRVMVTIILDSLAERATREEILTPIPLCSRTCRRRNCLCRRTGP